jgi:hypothetical protein
VPGQFRPESLKMIFHPGVTELVDNNIVDKGKGELYGLRVQDNIIGLGSIRLQFLV